MKKIFCLFSILFICLILSSCLEPKKMSLTIKEGLYESDLKTYDNQSVKAWMKFEEIDRMQYVKTEGKNYSSLVKDMGSLHGENNMFDAYFVSTVLVIGDVKHYVTFNHMNGSRSIDNYYTISELNTTLDGLTNMNFTLFDSNLDLVGDTAKLEFRINGESVVLNLVNEEKSFKELNFEGVANLKGAVDENNTLTNFNVLVSNNELVIDGKSIGVLAYIGELDYIPNIVFKGDEGTKLYNMLKFVESYYLIDNLNDDNSKIYLMFVMDEIYILMEESYRIVSSYQVDIITKETNN